MKVCFCRVDYRLLHGQVTNAWTSKYKIKHIFVVDDELYKDDIARRVLMMASPSKVNTSVYSTDQMAGILQQTSIHSSDSKAAVLVKSLEDAEKLFSKAGKITNRLILGSVSCGIGRSKVCDRLFLSKEERKIVKDMSDKYAIQIEHQVLPGDTPVDVIQCLTDK